MNAYNQKLPELTIRYKKGDFIASTIKTSQDAADLLRSVFDADLLEFREEMILILINRANRPLGFVKISSGGMTSTVCDPRIVFGVALRSGATGLLLAHNHPSGNLHPSKQDLELTKTLVEGGKLLDIQLMDHIIITAESYYSFADHGLM